MYHFDQTKRTIVAKNIYIFVESGYAIILTLTILGYVLDCLPSVAIGWKSVEEQISYLKELDLKPDVIINLKVQVEHLIS